MELLINLGGTDDTFLIRWFLLLIVGTVIVTVIAGLCLTRWRWKLHRVYFLVVLWFGLFYMAVFSPLSAPDEVVHFVTAYELSDRLMLTPARDSDDHIRIRAEDEYIVNWPGDNDPTKATVLGMTLDRAVYEELHEHGLFKMTRQGMDVTWQVPAVTTPLAYLCPAVGISIARLLHMSCFGLLFMGRLMNLLLFTILGTLAVKRMPIGRMVVFMLSLFPMTLELAASYSYDAFLLPLAFTLISEVLRLSYTERDIRVSDAVRLSILAVLLAPCKMIYATLFLLCLMIAPRKFGSDHTYIRNYILAILLIGVMIVGSILLVNFREFFRYVNTTGTVAPELDSEGNVQTVVYHDLMELVRDKTLIFRVIRNSFQILGGEYLGTTVGMWLSAMDRSLGAPVWMCILFWTLLLVAAIAPDYDEPSLGITRRLLTLATGLLTGLLLFVSMFTAYTPKDTWYILGIQGRYFIPFLPLLLLPFHITGRPADPILRRLPILQVQNISIILCLCLNAYVLWQSFFTIIAR